MHHPHRRGGTRQAGTRRGRARVRRIWNPRRDEGPKRRQKRAKRHQQRDQSDIKFLIDFWIDFRLILEGPRELDGAPGPPVRNARGLTIFENIEEDFEHYLDIPDHPVGV